MGIKTMVASGLTAAAVFGGVGLAAAATGGGAPAPTPKASAATASASTGSASTAADCAGRDGQWPEWVEGRPAGLDAGDPGLVYLWHDDGGWHLRVTHRGDDRRVVTGTIATRGTITAERVADERDDRVSVGPEGHLLRFRFVDYGRMDGVDFTTRCAPSLQVSLRTGDGPVPTSAVDVGRADRHPDDVPFAVRRAG